jgi:2-dehydro-3-deoxyphosphogluconate aldolase/(4S)-4-hydroxy-2-oxoglutarate aldolase
MTVPGAVELIRDLAPTLPEGFILGAGTVLDAETVRAGRRCRRALRRQPGLPALGDRGVPRARLAAMPGCFTPTEILDAWDCRRRHRQGLPGHHARDRRT